KITTVIIFIVSEWGLSSRKTPACQSVACNDEKCMNERDEWVQYLISTDIDYPGNCVFINESGFDINTRPS
ncbi:hypothetical protein BDF14DRAFT_1712513, partial [Spinellus fusiger]